jgi:hypothetical protein
MRDRHLDADWERRSIVEIHSRGGATAQSRRDEIGDARSAQLQIAVRRSIAAGGFINMLARAVDRPPGAQLGILNHENRER